VPWDLLDGYDLINAAAACPAGSLGLDPGRMNPIATRMERQGLPLRYRLFGLGVASDLPLPELREDEGEDEGGAPPDVTIRTGPLPEPREPLEPIGDHVELAPAELRLKLPGIGDFLVRDGREIFVEPHGDASPEDLRAYLLGSVIGGLIHQAGLLPLHASAVARDGRAAAFIGRSGAGKSTLAHRLSVRGWELLSDDVCAVHGGIGAPPLVWPGIRQFKLWDSSLAAAGESKAGLQPVLMRDDKFLLPTDRLADDRPHRLALVYVLARDESAGQSRIDPVTGMDAVHALVSNTYRGIALRSMGRSAWHLRRCTDLAQQCRIFCLTMAWGFEHADHAYALIAEHMMAEFGDGT
jgi:hypothetical protein